MRIGSLKRTTSSTAITRTAVAINFLRLLCPVVERGKGTRDVGGLARKARESGDPRWPKTPTLTDGNEGLRSVEVEGRAM